MLQSATFASYESIGIRSKLTRLKPSRLTQWERSTELKYLIGIDWQSVLVIASKEGHYRSWPV